MTQSIYGLEDWERFCYPDVQCEINKEATYGVVWKSSELAYFLLSMIDLLEFEVVRRLKIQYSINKVCSSPTIFYVICNRSSVIIPLWTGISSLDEIRLPDRLQCTCLDEIEDGTLAIGTNRPLVLLNERDYNTISLPIPDFEDEEVTSIKATRTKIYAGLGNGYVVRLNRDESGAANIPNFEDESSPVVGIDVISVLNDDFVLVFRELPSTLSVVKDTETSIETLCRFGLDGNLIQMVVNEEDTVAISTIENYVLKVWIYDFETGLNIGEPIHAYEYSEEEYKSILGFFIPSQSIFLTSDTTGSDLYELKDGGSNITLKQLSSDPTELTLRQIADTGIIMNTERLQLADENMSEIDQGLNEDFLNAVVEKNNSSVIVNILSKKYNNDSWLSLSQLHRIQEWTVKRFLEKYELVEDFKRRFIQVIHDNENPFEFITDSKIIINYLYEIQNVLAALNFHKLCYEENAQTTKMIFIMRIMDWVVSMNIKEYVKELKWTERSEKLAHLTKEASEKLSIHLSSNLYIEKYWTENPEIFWEVLTEILSKSPQEEFVNLFLYILCDIVLIESTAEQLIEDFLLCFLVDRAIEVKVRGFWQLDLLFDPRNYDFDGNKVQSFYESASGALSFLTDTFSTLKFEEKKSILKSFFLTNCNVECTVWSQMTMLQDEECFRLSLHVLLDQELWDQAILLPSQYHGTPMFYKTIEILVFSIFKYNKEFLIGSLPKIIQNEVDIIIKNFVGENLDELTYEILKSKLNKGNEDDAARLYDIIEEHLNSN